MTKKPVVKKAQTPTKPAAAKAAAAKPATVKAATAKPAEPKPTASKPAIKQVSAPVKTVVAVAKPAPKKRHKRIRYVKPTAITVIEAMDRQSLISGISEDGRFVYIRVTPETIFRKGQEIIAATAIVDGMQLACWGGWEQTAPEVYSAKGVLIKGRLDDYALRMKINDACQRLSRARSEVASAPVEPTPASQVAPKPEEKKPDEKKPEEPKPTEPKPVEPKPVDPNAPPAPEEPKPAEPNPIQPENP